MGEINDRKNKIKKLEPNLCKHSVYTKIEQIGTSLVVQWLRLHTPNQGLWV